MLRYYQQINKYFDFIRFLRNNLIDLDSLMKEYPKIIKLLTLITYTLIKLNLLN